LRAASLRIRSIYISAAPSSQMRAKRRTSPPSTLTAACETLSFRPSAPTPVFRYGPTLRWWSVRHPALLLSSFEWPVAFPSLRESLDFMSFPRTLGAPSSSRSSTPSGRAAPRPAEACMQTGRLSMMRQPSSQQRETRVQLVEAIPTTSITTCRGIGILLHSTPRHASSRHPKRPRFTTCTFNRRGGAGPPCLTNQFQLHMHSHYYTRSSANQSLCSCVDRAWPDFEGDEFVLLTLLPFLFERVFCFDPVVLAIPY